MAEKIKLPTFLYPVHEWAEKIRVVCLSAEIDITTEVATKLLSHKVFALLPAAVLRAAPKTSTLDALLKWLEAYDDQKLTITTVMARTISFGDRPSIFYDSLVSEISKCLPTADADTVEIMAWNRLCEVLPGNVKAAILMMDRTRPPTRATLDNLDNAVANMSGEQNHSVCAVSASPAVQDSRFEKLEKDMLELKQLLRDNLSSKAPSVVCFSCGGSGHYATACPSKKNDNGINVSTREKQRGAQNPNLFQCGRCHKRGHNANNCRADLKQQNGEGQFTSFLPQRSNSFAPSTQFANVNGRCWYHSRFGQNAAKCTEPYTFAPKLNH